MKKSTIYQPERQTCRSFPVLYPHRDQELKQGPTEIKQFLRNADAESLCGKASETQVRIDQFLQFPERRFSSAVGFEFLRQLVYKRNRTLVIKMLYAGQHRVVTGYQIEAAE